MKRTTVFLLLALAAVWFSMEKAAAASVDKGVTADGSVCDKINWTDASGNPRSIAIVAQKDHEGLWGGYICQIDYVADGKVRECKANGGSLGGFGHVVMHGANPRGWAISRQDARNLETGPQILGEHHVQYVAKMDITTTAGFVPVIVSYFVRDGRDDFVYTITFDTSQVKGLTADTRSPYVEFDWEGNGSYGGPISGFGWGTANKEFRTTGDVLSGKSPWDWTKDCVIPHIIEWKNEQAGNAELGLIQTQTYAQHDAGAGSWGQQGKTGVGMPPNWNLPYQLNAYQGFTCKKATWMMQYGAVGHETYDVFDHSRKASGYPMQRYALLCVLDKYSDKGVDAAIDEMNTVQNSSLTSTVGTVAKEEPITHQAYAPAGWDHLLAVWSIACANNEASGTLTIKSGTLKNPTFCFTDFHSLVAPATFTLDDKSLKEADYLATLDRPGRRLLVTLKDTLEAGAHTFHVKGEPNTTTPEFTGVTLTPASLTQGTKTTAALTASVMDPTSSIKSVTVDLKGIGGAEAEAMKAGKKGDYALAIDVPADAPVGKKILKLTAINAGGKTDEASVGLSVHEPPKTYTSGTYWDFSDGTSQNWEAANSKGEMAKDNTFNGAANAFKVTAGNWGACFKNEKDDFSHCKTLKFQLFAEPAKEGQNAWPQVHVNGGNTNSWIGPNPKGDMDTGKWVECTVDLSKRGLVSSLLIQVYGAKTIYIGQVWADAMPVREVKK